jgi:hypothetical protein
MGRRRMPSDLARLHDDLRGRIARVSDRIARVSD